MVNKEIRDSIKINKVKKWEIAYLLEVTDFTFSRWLRKELSQEKKSLIMAAIEKLTVRQ